MSAEGKVEIRVSLTGLGPEVNMEEAYTLDATPDAATYARITQTTTDTAQALELGDVSTVELICIKAVTNELDVDCDFDTSFDADLDVEEGEVAMYKPSGTVYIKNHTAGEVCVFDLLVLGTT